MSDPGFDDLLSSLSDAAELHDPGLSRRRFLQGVLAAGVATVAAPTVLASEAWGASRLGAGEGVLVVAILGGGNDGLNVHAPLSAPERGRYEQLRGPLALAPDVLLPTDSGYGLHPDLRYLHGRFHRGQVALIRGAALPATPLSHTEAIAATMAGTSDGSTSTGWLGRYLDGVSESRNGLRGLAVGPSVPLYLRGTEARITTVPDYPAPEPGDVDSVGIRQVLRGYGAQPTGLGALGDELAQVARESLDRGRLLQPAYAGQLPPSGIARDLVLAARLVNLDLGARVIGVTLGGFDTHFGQATTQANLLRALDDGIEAFFATLAPAYRNRTALMAVSEFGRRPARNGSGGTDHGTANLVILAGDNVRGGLHAADPSLDQLDARGNPKPTVDLRSAYASMLSRWLGGDAQQVLGSTYGEIDVFAAGPGASRA